MTIPVICDRCRKTGLAGDGDFTHLGDLLAFEPVPVQPRVNGWDAEAQRAFIALLASTGSKRRAALAIGRNAHGIDQLLKRPDSDSFKCAYDRAMAIAKQNGATKIAQGVADAAARNAQLTAPSRLRGHERDDDASSMDEETKLALIENIHRKFLGKVRQEREARLAGEVVAADFYLRQVTFIEVAFDMMSEGLGLDGWQLLGELRRGGHGILEIAETAMSKALDDKRRELWAAMAEPERPEHPPERYLVEHDDHSIEPLEYMRGGSEEEREDQRAEYARLHAVDAQAQAEWEQRLPLPLVGEGRGEGEGQGMPSDQHPDSIEYLSSLESEEDILAALMRDAESEDY